MEFDFEDWQRKQNSLSKFLRDHQAEKAPYRVDLDKKKIYWVDRQELSLVVADCQALLSYALSNNSVLMAWANASLGDGSAIDPVDGMSDFYSDCQPEDAWELAMMAATAVKADALYRTPSPQSWVMLALWNLRPGGAEQFVSGSPDNHVKDVLINLIEHPVADQRQILMDNYAESFLQMASHPYRQTPHERRLRDLSRDLRNLLIFGEDQSEKQVQGMKKLLQEWQQSSP